MPTLTKEIIEAAIDGFEAQKQRIDSQIAGLRAMLSPAGNGTTRNAPAAGPKKRRMSAAGRRAIAAAQKKRWAAIKGNVAPKAPKKVKRKLSAAGKAAIVAALKKRWAAKRAASA